MKSIGHDVRWDNSIDEELVADIHVEHLLVVRELRHACVDRLDYGVHDRLYAARDGCYDCVEALIAKGADVNSAACAISHCTFGSPPGMTIPYFTSNSAPFCVCRRNRIRRGDSVPRHLRG